MTKKTTKKISKNNLPSKAEENNLEVLKNKFLKQKNIKLIIFLFIIVLIIIFFKSCNATSSIGLEVINNNRKDPGETGAFYIKNNNGKYAIFNKDGDKLTKFEFSEATSFMNGYSLNKIKDKQVIVSENGKIALINKKYENIKSFGPFFLGEEKGTKKTHKYLLTGTGKIIADSNDFEFVSQNRTYVVLKDIKKQKIIVLNYKSKIIYQKNITKKDKDINVSRVNNYILIKDKNITTIFDNSSNKKISSIKNMTSNLKELDYNEFKNKYSFTQDNKYKILDNNKINELPKECKNILVRNNLLMCSTKDKTNIITEKYKLGQDISKVTLYYDEKHYVSKKDFEKITIYNGKNQNKLDNVELVFTYSEKKLNNKVIIVYNLEQKEYEAYDFDGDKLFSKSLKSLSNYDKAANAIAKEKNREFLIDIKGNKISDEYYDIEILEEDNKIYYLVKNEKGYSGLLDEKGRQLIKPRYRQYIKEIDNEKCIISSNEKHTTVYNLKERKKVLDVKGKTNIYDNYAEVFGKERKLYSLKTGKAFYKIK